MIMASLKHSFQCCIIWTLTFSEKIMSSKNLSLVMNLAHVFRQNIEKMRGVDLINSFIKVKPLTKLFLSASQLSMKIEK